MEAGTTGVWGLSCCEKVGQVGLATGEEEEKEKKEKRRTREGRTKCRFPVENPRKSRNMSFLGSGRGVPKNYSASFWTSNF